MRDGRNFDDLNRDKLPMLRANRKMEWNLKGKV